MKNELKDPISGATPPELPMHFFCKISRVHCLLQNRRNHIRYIGKIVGNNKFLHWIWLHHLRNGTPTSRVAEPKNEYQYR